MAKEIDKAFEAWWETDVWDGCNEHSIASDGFHAGWLEACRRAAEAAWKAETHHDALQAINEIAEAIVWEPK